MISVPLTRRFSLNDQDINGVDPSLQHREQVFDTHTQQMYMHFLSVGLSLSSKGRSLSSQLLDYSRQSLGVHTALDQLEQYGQSLAVKACFEDGRYLVQDYKCDERARQVNR